jgi:hypothetical protein
MKMLLYMTPIIISVALLIVRYFISAIAVSKAKKKYIGSTDTYERIKYVSKIDNRTFDSNSRLRAKRESYSKFVQPCDSSELLTFVKNCDGGIR